MNEVSMTAFSAPIHETCAFKFGNKFSYLLWHEITLRYVAGKISYSQSIDSIASEVSRPALCARWRLIIG